MNATDFLAKAYHFVRVTVMCVLLCLPTQALAAPVTMQVVDGDTRSVLLSIARLGGVQLVLGDDIKGKVTLNATAEPAALLGVVADASGLTLTKVGDIYLIAGAGRIESTRRPHIYTARYASPDTLAQAVNLSLSLAGKKTNTATTKDKQSGTTEKITTTTGSTSSARDSYVTVDNVTSSIVYYSTTAEAEHIEALLAELDVPPRQVELEAKVVAISKDASKELGIEWEWSALPQYPETTKTYRRKGTENEYVEYDVNRKWNGDSQVPGIIQFGRGPEGVPFEFYYSAKINALVTDGKAKILARPNIKTMQGREAVINIGSEVPVPTRSETDTRSTTTYTYRETGIILRYTPWVNADGGITAQVHTEVSSPLYVQDISAYKFQKRSADTTLRLRDGETMVIGGLIGSEESKTLSKIPFLGDLPILGAFFRNQKTSHTESEIMIFLTAKVLDDTPTAQSASTDTSTGK